jgi:hypothetical protein
MEPKKAASKAKMPPSAPTSQYPTPSASGTSDCTGAFRRAAPIEPRKRAEPKANTPPSLATI